jgi:hypothetical protein
VLQWQSESASRSALVLMSGPVSAWVAALPAYTPPSWLLPRRLPGAGAQSWGRLDVYQSSDKAACIEVPRGRTSNGRGGRPRPRVTGLSPTISASSAGTSS